VDFLARPGANQAKHPARWGVLLALAEIYTVLAV
jgi:hypothetical protein